MNTRFLKTLSLRSALLLGSWGALVSASNAQPAIARAAIPFEFAAGGAMMPPGEYTVEVPDSSGVILLRSSAGSSVALLAIFSGAISPATFSKLIFERRDGIAYLSTVEWRDQSAHLMSAFKPITKGAASAALR